MPSLLTHVIMVRDSLSSSLPSIAERERQNERGEGKREVDEGCKVFVEGEEARQRTNDGEFGKMKTEREREREEMEGERDDYER